MITMANPLLTDYFQRKSCCSLRNIIRTTLVIIVLSCIGSCSVTGNASKNESSDSCATQLCKDAVKKMAKKMDLTVEPCNDFYQFTCGKYINPEDPDYESNESADVLTELREKMKKQLISSLSRESNVNDTEPMKIAKYLYQTCANTSAIDEGLAPFLNILEQVGGWPVLKENETWNEAAFNWNRVIFKIGDKKYWNNIFIHARPQRFGVFIYEPFQLDIISNRNDKQKIINYFNYMIDMAVSMGASKTYATKELNDTLEFEIKLADIIHFTSNNKIFSRQVVGRMDPINQRSMTIGDLMKNYSFIPWDEYIKSQLPVNVTLGDINDKILVFDVSYLNSLKNLIESTPKKTIANYVIWRYIDNFAYYLNTNISNIKENYENSKGKGNKKTDCFEILDPKMSLILNALYTREYLDKDTMANVRVIFNNVGNGFVESLKNSSWIDNETKNRFMAVAMNISSTIEFPENLLDESMTNKYLQDLRFVNGSYIENIFAIDMFTANFAWKCLNPLNLLIAQECWEWKLSATYALHDEILRSFKSDLLFAPPGFLQDTMYSYDLPDYINYGRIGNSIGYNIVKRFAINTKYGKDINGNTFDLPMETNNTYHSKIQCIEEQYKDLINNAKLKKFVPLTSDSNIADNSGIRAAYFAYKKLSKTHNGQKIGDKVYTAQQMFWISAASIWCRKPNEPVIKEERSISKPRFRVIGSVSNMREFADDFKCPIGSPMNPSEKCQVW